MSDWADRANEPTSEASVEVEAPAPSYWPMVLAAGMTLAAAGLVTHWALSALGGVLALVGFIGWIANLGPGAGETRMPLRPPEEWPEPIHPASGAVEPLKPGAAGHRMRIPEKVHPYSAGVTGGLVGGVAMALLALGYGVASGKGIWFPVNLLAAMVVPGMDRESAASLEQYSQTGLIIGVAIHVAGSLATGLVYGVLLPMFPSRPILWGGVVAPLLWTGMLHSLMGVINPVMSELVDWRWFVASQVAFGLTAGLVVVQFEKRPTTPAMPAKEATMMRRQDRPEARL